MPRLATTNEQKILKGTFKPYLARSTAHSGNPLKELPEPILPMSDAAAMYYQSIGQGCINMGILEPADLDELELCCYEFGVYWEFEDERKKIKKEINKAKKEFKELESQELENGKPDLYLLRYKQSLINDLTKSYKIALSQRNTSFTSAVKMSAKFGLNPVDRQKLSVTPPQIENDPFAEE